MDFDLWIGITTIMVVGAGLVTQWLTHKFMMETKFRDLRDLIGKRFNELTASITEDHKQEQDLGKESLRHSKTVSAWVSQARSQLTSLYKWHDVRDTDGSPIWYVRPSMESVMKEIRQEVQKSAASNRAVADELKELTNELRRLADLREERNQMQDERR